ncbi:hypothetical protein ACFLZM_03035 [Thermodesulfobacteriota bacterium]
MKFENDVYAFVHDLGRFDCDISGADLLWNLIFPDPKGKWFHLHVVRYRRIFYISHIDGNCCSLEVEPKKNVKPMQSFGFSSYENGRDDPAVAWGPIITSARLWLKAVEKDWIKANKRVQKDYPLNRRYGIAPNSLIRASIPEIYRLDEALGKVKSRKFISLVEDVYFLRDENTIKESMTAKDYFDYCKIAYLHGRRKDEVVDEALSGREMYERFSDGRHEGLLDIDENSKQAFSDWIDGKHPKKTTGGHPWEIKRGGNTTHIDLSVYRPQFHKLEGFKIELCGASINRLKETIQIFLGIHAASLPITISDPEGIRKRLLAQDNIGIVPSYAPLHRANQHFKKDQFVYDVLYYDDLGRYKRRITPFITWEPLPVFKPKNI